MEVKTNVKSYILSVFGVAVLTSILAPLQSYFSLTTIGFAYLILVLFTARSIGSFPAIMAAILSAGCYNFFFIPPLYTFTIDDSRNWFALAAFLITAIAVGQLSIREKHRAEQAVADKVEIERLYIENHEVWEQAKQAEMFKQSEKLKSALLDAVTHDLRTPLTSIKASVTTLLAENSVDEPIELDNEARYEFLHVINDETDRLNRFIENLVDLAKIEAGKLSTARRWSSIEDIISLVQHRASALIASHKVNVYIEDDLPAIKVDSMLIAEVIYSLLDNAAKYSPLGSNIDISAKREGIDMIQISIEDQGKGIPEELRQKVFDKFYSITTDEEYGAGAVISGLGMGLTIAHGIVEAHNGRIWIEDGKNGKGTKMIFVVPIGDYD